MRPAGIKLPGAVRAPADEAEKHVADVGRDRALSLTQGMCHDARGRAYGAPRLRVRICMARRFTVHEVRVFRDTQKNPGQ